MSRAVLIVDDDAQMAHGMGEVLRRQRLDVDLAGTAEDALQRFGRRRYDVVVSDLRLPGMSGDELVVELRQRRPDVPVLLVTAYATMDSAIHCLRNGVSDYLMKPIAPEALASAVRRLLPTAPGPEDPPPVAEDPATRAALALAERAAVSNATVLLEAESGAGKEVFARWMHRRGPRAGGPFVAVNCAAIPRELLEAELFGHTRGAFTGAVRDRLGTFREADGGTLLLDEIGEMQPELQARLLRVLQDRTVKPVGSERTFPVDVRIVAATHRDLATEVRDGRFREDLYFRLRVVPIRIPPLRERPGDIEPLVRQFLEEKSGGRVAIAAAALTCLTRHPWPGNVRELHNVLQRALVLSPSATIDLDDLSFDSLQRPRAATGDEPWSLEDAEWEAIRRSLRRSSGNRQLAAETLGISQRTLRHKLKQFRDRGRPVTLEDPQGGHSLPQGGKTSPADLAGARR